MKKKVFLSVFVLIPALTAYFVFFQKSIKKNVSTQPEQIQPESKTEDAKSDTADEITAISKNYSESSEKYKYQISINYPFFENLPDKKIADLINSQIETQVQKEVDKYIAEARRNKITPAFGYLTGNYEYFVSYENILSVKIEGEKYLSGATGISVFFIDLNYNLKSGEQISLFK